MGFKNPFQSTYMALVFIEALYISLCIKIFELCDVILTFLIKSPSGSHDSTIE